MIPALLAAFDALTTGPWPFDLIALAGSLTAAGVVWRMLVQPVGRAIWAAILAAPRIAAGIDRLFELVEGDVLSRLEAGSKSFERIEAKLIDHEARLLILERADPNAPTQIPA